MLWEPCGARRCQQSIDSDPGRGDTRPTEIKDSTLTSGLMVIVSVKESLDPRLDAHHKIIVIFLIKHYIYRYLMHLYNRGRGALYTTIYPERSYRSNNLTVQL